MNNENESNTNSPAPGLTPKKGKPTPTRKEAQSARVRPLVPKDRKAAKRASKEKDRAKANFQHEALMKGDEANFPLQHRGPHLRLVRDIVDSRRNLAEFFFPVALIAVFIVFALQFIAPKLFIELSPIILLLIWGSIIGVIIDSFILRKKIRRLATERFGSVPRGSVGYGIMRSTNIRRWRIPKPVIKYGEEPRK